MTDEQLAKQSADRLWSDDGEPNGFESDLGYSKLERALSSTLRGEPPNYQLHFLFRVQALAADAREEHTRTCNVTDKTKCPQNIYYFQVDRLVRQRIIKINPNYDRQSLNSELVNKTLVQFKDFPIARDRFQIALDKFIQGGDDRSIVDDMRLALELFLREKLGNTLSVEKQIPVLGLFLKDKGASPEIMNMFIKLVDGYMKYQNENVKHGDKLKRDEVELMINLTLTFINFIVIK
jgi:hypothetical protein